MILRSRLKETSKHPAIQVIKEYSDLPLVCCYAGQLNQVFMNVISNAIDALEQAREQDDNPLTDPTIWIRTQVLEPGWVQVAIADNGPGIPSEVQQRLFDPFFTTKPVGKGTGMGLSISYQIVTERHQGRFYCQSEVGKGAEFRVEIPIGEATLVEPSLPTAC
jgi:signal transduction histidine kinase